MFALLEGDGLVMGAVNDEERWCVGVDVGDRAGQPHQFLAFGEGAAEQLGEGVGGPVEVPAVSDRGLWWWLGGLVVIEVEEVGVGADGDDGLHGAGVAG